MNSFLAWFRANWKSNLIATGAIIYSAQAFTSAVLAWQNHQPANWRAGIVSLLVAGVGYVSKDYDTHSTPAQVQASGAAVAGDPKAPELAKAADLQAVGK